MADPEYRQYSVPVGEKGTIYLRDDGSYCTFYLQVKDPEFTKSGLIWDYSWPQTKGTMKFTYPPGGTLYAFNSASVFTSGEIVGTLRKTGTSQLGDGATIKVSISRTGELPGKPDLWSPTMLSATSARLYWNMRNVYESGLSITQFDVGYGTSPTKPDTIINNAVAGSTYEQIYNVTGLSTNKLYYFFVRARTSKGIGPWCDPRGILTSGGVMVKYKGRWRNAVPYVMESGVWKQARAYYKHGASWKLTR